MTYRSSRPSFPTPRSMLYCSSGTLLVLAATVSHSARQVFSWPLRVSILTLFVRSSEKHSAETDSDCRKMWWRNFNEMSTSLVSICLRCRTCVSCLSLLQHSTTQLDDEGVRRISRERKSPQMGRESSSFSNLICFSRIRRFSARVAPSLN